MVASYTWHPGSGCVSPKWTIPVPLQPDELFSSWLARAALGLGCDPLVLTGAIWPKWRVWTMDPDRGVGEERLKALSEASGVLVAAFQAATLRSIASEVNGTLPQRKAIWPWVLALGSRNRKHRGGLQYCAACLAEDRIPYYRLQWRLAWHTVCKAHHLDLRDRCPHCGAPIEPHRLRAIDRQVAICASCGQDLRRYASAPAQAGALMFQNMADDAVLVAAGRYGTRTIPATDWFSLSRQLISRIRRAPPFSMSTGLPLELIHADERSRLLSAAAKILDVGPQSLLRSAKVASIERESLQRMRRAALTYFDETASLRPGFHSKRNASATLENPRSKSKAAVLRSWARLQRKLAM